MENDGLHCIFITLYATSYGETRVATGLDVSEEEADLLTAQYIVQTGALDKQAARKKYCSQLVHSIIKLCPADPDSSEDINRFLYTDENLTAAMLGNGIHLLDLRCPFPSVHTLSGDLLDYYYNQYISEPRNMPFLTAAAYRSKHSDKNLVLRDYTFSADVGGVA